MGPSLGVGLRPLPAEQPFPEGLQPSASARFPLSAAKPSSPCFPRQEGASPEPALHGRPSEERKPSWEEAGARRQGRAPALQPLSARVPACAGQGSRAAGGGGDCCGGLFILFLPVAKLRAAGAWHFSCMWQELLTNTCFPPPSLGMPWGPHGGCDVMAGGSRDAPSQGSPPPGLSCPGGSCGIWASLFLSEVWPSRRAAETCPCPGEGTLAPPTPSPTSPACPLGAQPPARRGLGLGRDPARRAGKGGMLGGRARTRGVRSKAFFY